MREVENRLIVLSDEKYKEFQSRLVPSVSKSLIIGVRMPVLRNYAKILKDTGMAEAFLRELPHRFYDENNLHGILISEIEDYKAAVAAVEEFLPFIDNWATCDMLAPKAFAKKPEGLTQRAASWLRADEPYTVRFGIGVFMRHYLDDAFELSFAEKVASVRNDEYYVQTMQAWYFAEALVKQYDAVLPIIRDGKMEKWVHNKAIQKALESTRISPEKKAYLKTLKR